MLCNPHDLDLGRMMKINGLIVVYEPLLARLIDESDGTMYRAFYLQPNPEVKLSVDQVRQFQRIYLIGILERSHLACMTFLARSHRWLKACRGAIETSNILSFSASLRGFLESAADGFDAIGYLPGTLKDSFEHVYSFLYELDERNTAIIMKELEDRLIHYAFATRQPKIGPSMPNHKAKSQADYIRDFEKVGAWEAGNLYRDLCALTHPSSESVSCFLIEGEHLMSFTAQHDDTSIETILYKYEECIMNSFQYSLNSALIALAYLKRLNSDWIGPEDVEVNTIGNTGSKLKQVDEFVKSHIKNGATPTSLRQQLHSLVVSLGIE
jgi:hypothetical protein